VIFFILCIKKYIIQYLKENEDLKTKNLELLREHVLLELELKALEEEEKILQFEKSLVNDDMNNYI